MGMDGLTEQKMPEGVPEPRIPNLGLCEGTEQTSNTGRKFLPHVRLHRPEGYL